MTQIERLLQERIGLDATSIGSTLIHRTVRSRMKSHGLKRLEDYHGLLGSSRAEWEHLVESVVVAETWFFRDGEPFSGLARLVAEEWLPSHGSETARLLSLPCSSGEEPFSIAMSLLEAGVPAERFAIDAIDISARALERAKHSTYGANAFRGKNLKFRLRYFEACEGGDYCLKPEVRKCVRFHRANLVSDDFTAPNDAYDFIFFRNLLIYFDRSTQQKALAKVERLLGPKGILFVGAAEQPQVIERGLIPVHLPRTFAFQRVSPAATTVSRRIRPGVVPADREMATEPSPRTQSVGAVSPDVQGRGQPSDAPDVELETARRLADAGHLKEATGICEEHLRRKGASAQAYYLLGVLHDAAGESGAEDYYRKALYLEPNHYESLMHLAMWLQKNGEVARARRLKNRAERARTETSFRE